MADEGRWARRNSGEARSGGGGGGKKRVGRGVREQAAGPRYSVQELLDVYTAIAGTPLLESVPEGLRDMGAPCETRREPAMLLLGRGEGGAVGAKKQVSRMPERDPRERNEREQGQREREGSAWRRGDRVPTPKKSEKGGRAAAFAGTEFDGRGGAFGEADADAEVEWEGDRELENDGDDEDMPDWDMPDMDAGAGELDFGTIGDLEEEKQNFLREHGLAPNKKTKPVGRAQPPQHRPQPKQSEGEEQEFDLDLLVDDEGETGNATLAPQGTEVTAAATSASPAQTSAALDLLKSGIGILDSGGSPNREHEDEALLPEDSDGLGVLRGIWGADGEDTHADHISPIATPQNRTNDSTRERGESTSSASRILTPFGNSIFSTPDQSIAVKGLLESSTISFGSDATNANGVGVKTPSAALALSSELLDEPEPGARSGATHFASTASSASNAALDPPAPTPPTGPPPAQSAGQPLSQQLPAAVPPPSHANLPGQAVIGIRPQPPSQPTAQSTAMKVHVHVPQLQQQQQSPHLQAHLQPHMQQQARQQHQYAYQAQTPHFVPGPQHQGTGPPQPRPQMPPQPHPPFGMPPQAQSYARGPRPQGPIPPQPQQLAQQLAQQVPQQQPQQPQQAYLPQPPAPARAAAVPAMPARAQNEPDTKPQFTFHAAKPLTTTKKKKGVARRGVSAASRQMMQKQKLAKQRAAATGRRAEHKPQNAVSSPPPVPAAPFVDDGADLPADTNPIQRVAAPSVVVASSPAPTL